MIIVPLYGSDLMVKSPPREMEVVRKFKVIFSGFHDLHWTQGLVDQEFTDSDKRVP